MYGPVSFRTGSTQLDGLRIATHNGFFREENSNSPHLASVVAPAIMGARPAGETLEVADIGCSMGKDTWSTAAAFIVRGVRAHITAFDVNPMVLAYTDQPYRQTLAELRQKVANWGLPLDCIDLFEEVDEYHIRPGAELRERVSFKRLDIRNQALTPDFDAIIANNVLSYYTSSKSRLGPVLGNIASGLRSSNLLTVSTYYKAFEPEFGNRGFVPAADWCPTLAAPTFFRLQSGVQQ